jgi:hypothetical protein
MARLHNMVRRSMIDASGCRALSRHAAGLPGVVAPGARVGGGGGGGVRVSRRHHRLRCARRNTPASPPAGCRESRTRTCANRMHGSATAGASRAQWPGCRCRPAAAGLSSRSWPGAEHLARPAVCRVSYWIFRMNSVFRCKDELRVFLALLKRCSERTIICEVRRSYSISLLVRVDRLGVAHISMLKALEIRNFSF